MDDPFDLKRFVEAHDRAYAQALSEVRSGYKWSHWMWFIFPQMAGLGSTTVSRHYAIKSVAEAEAYLNHPILGPHLREISEAALNVPDRTAYDIFGSPDDLKLRSCATLFAAVSPPGSVFDRILKKYYSGEPDRKTLKLIGRG